MNRREFLKGIGALLAGLFIPKKAENQVPVLRQETFPIDFYLPIPGDGVPLRKEVDTGYREEVPSAVSIYDILADFNESVTTQANMPPGEPIDELKIPADPVLYRLFCDAIDEFVIAQANMPQWVTCQCGSQYWIVGDDASTRCSNCGSLGNVMFCGFGT